MLRAVFSRGPRRWLAQAALTVAAVLVAMSAAGQTFQGGVRGLVRDAEGVIPGAEVTLTSDETNASRGVVSNDVGEYVFSGVQPGVYTVKVGLSGFATEERQGLRVGTQQTLVQDFTLRVGQVSEQITVTGQAPLVERSSATVATSLGQASLQNLPIFGRNAFYAAISTPGVIQSGDPQFVRFQDQTNALVLVIGRRAAARQRLSDRRGADDRLHQSTDHRAVD